MEGQIQFRYETYSQKMVMLGKQLPKTKLMFLDSSMNYYPIGKTTAKDILIQGRKGILNDCCAGYLLIRQPFEKSKREFR